MWFLGANLKVALITSTHVTWARTSYRCHLMARETGKCNLAVYPRGRALHLKVCGHLQCQPEKTTTKNKQSAKCMPMQVKGALCKFMTSV